MTERDDQGHTIAPDGGTTWHLQGRVVQKVLNEGTVMQRRLPCVLEQEPGGNFLALHGKQFDMSAFAGKWVEVEGKVWMQSIIVRSINEISPPT